MSTPEPMTIMYYAPEKFERVRQLLLELHPEDTWDDHMVMGYVFECARDNLKSRVSRKRRQEDSAALLPDGVRSRASE